MNGNTGARRGLRRAGALAVVLAVAVLVTGCGLVHVHVGLPGSPASAGPSAFRANLAFARCMRTHGVPDFPVPANASESFHITRHLSVTVHLGTTRHLSGTGFPGPMGRATDACQHLLPPGSITASRSR